MRYHDITTNDMKNGEGLRTVLWLSGCKHHCDGCHNKVTWDPDDGMIFDHKAEKELFEKLEPYYISGLTLSGGDPLHPKNCHDVYNLLQKIHNHFNAVPYLRHKTIWMYTGYTWEEIFRGFDYRDPEIRGPQRDQIVIPYVDVLVEGRFVKELADPKYPWAGSTNQRVIDVKKSTSERIVIYESNKKGWNYRGFQQTENYKCCN